MAPRSDKGLLHHKGKTIPYVITRSIRAKRLRLRAVPSGIEIILGKTTSMKDGLDFLQQNLDWALSEIVKAVQGEKIKSEEAKAWDGCTLYQGSVYRLQYQVDPEEKKGRMEVSEDMLLLKMPAKSRSSALLLAYRWLVNQAEMQLNSRIEIRAAEMGVKVSSVRIRDQKTRWGSCSSGGRLSFSWRLIFAPAATLDYVVVHELAHIRQPNHSPEFWKIVSKYCPDHESHKDWLKENSAKMRLPVNPTPMGLTPEAPADTIQLTLDLL